LCTAAKQWIRIRANSCRQFLVEPSPAKLGTHEPKAAADAGGSGGEARPGGPSLLRGLGHVIDVLIRGEAHHGPSPRALIALPIRAMGV
jgi:hypothetical protein